jgi:hypothetical protein
MSPTRNRRSRSADAGSGPRIASTQVSIREHFVEANRPACPNIVEAHNAMTGRAKASLMKR